MILEAPTIQPTISTYEYIDLGAIAALRTLVSRILVIRTYLGTTIQVHQSYTSAATAPLSHASCTVLSNFVTEYSFGCSHPLLTLQCRSLIADQELPHIPPTDHKVHDRLIDHGFYFAFSPITWPEFRSPDTHLSTNGGHDSSFISDNEGTLLSSAACAPCVRNDDDASAIHSSVDHTSTSQFADVAVTHAGKRGDDRSDVTTDGDHGVSDDGVGSDYEEVVPWDRLPVTLIERPLYIGELISERRETVLNPVGSDNPAIPFSDTNPVGVRVASSQPADFSNNAPRNRPRADALEVALILPCDAPTPIPPGVHTYPGSDTVVAVSVWSGPQVSSTCSQLSSPGQSQRLSETQLPNSTPDASLPNQDINQSEYTDLTVTPASGMQSTRLVLSPSLTIDALVDNVSPSGPQGSEASIPSGGWSRVAARLQVNHAAADSDSDSSSTAETEVMQLGSEKCFRRQYLCPSQGQFFGDPGSFVEFFDPLHGSQEICAQNNVATFGPMVIWRVLATFSCDAGCDIYDDALDAGVPPIPVLIRRKPLDVSDD